MLNEILFLVIIIVLTSIIIWRMFNNSNKKFEKWKQEFDLKNEAYDAYILKYDELSQLKSISEEYRIIRALNAKQKVYNEVNS